MDKLLHFGISAGLTFILLTLLFSTAPQLRVETWRLSSAQAVRRRRVAFGAALGMALIVLLGIWKEWGDSLGLGNLETMDFIADVAGVAAGYFLAIGRLRDMTPTPKYRVQLRQQTGGRQSQGSTASTKGPQLRSKIRKGEVKKQE